MIHFEAAPTAAGDARVPDASAATGTQAPAPAPPSDGGEPLPPTIIVERLGDDVRMAVDIDGDAFIVTLTRSDAHALGAALIAAAGDGFYRTGRPNERPTSEL